MIAPVRLGVCAVLLALPAALQAGGQIRSGEHPDFTRLVLNTGAATEWAVSVTGRTVSLFFPGAKEQFQTGRVFDLIPKTRVSAVQSQTGPDGTRISLSLECDCRISTLDAGANYLAIDIADQTAPLLEGARIHSEGSIPDPEQPLREEKMVSNAEIALIEQLQKAADQGLIKLDETRKTQTESGTRSAPNLDVELSRLSPAVPPIQPGMPAQPSQPVMPISSHPRAEDQSNTLAMLFDSSQIQATTVFDRYSARHADRMTERATPLDCIPDHQIDVAYWSDGRELFEQVPELYAQMVGEFDKPNTPAVLELSQLYIRFGFGVEARNVLSAFEIDTPRSALLNDLSRIMDGGRVGPYGPLARTSACPGRHGLWLAVGGVAPAFHNDEHFSSVTSAFSDLPADLRMLIGPRFIENLLVTGHIEQARQIYDIVIRAGAEADTSLRIAEAVLVAKEGNPAIAIQALSDLIENNGTYLTSALRHVVAIAVEAGYPIPDRIDTDIRAALLQYRGSYVEPELRRLLALSLAGKGQLENAMKEIELASEPGEQTEDLMIAVKRILSSANPVRDGAAGYANVMLKSSDMLPTGPDGDSPREVIAQHLLELGLPGPAEKVVLPAAGRSVPARVLLAQTLIAQGKTERAHEIAASLPEKESADIHATAYEADGEYSRAQETLIAAGRADEAAALAWRSGDWSRVVDANEHSERTPLASYMANRDGNGATESEKPEELEPAAAFVEPLPRLDDPSLNSTRRLLATSNQLEEFIQTLLKSK